jgi:hypothetical protein
VDGSTTWAAVSGPMQATAPASASLTIAGTIGYVLGPTGQVLRGDLTAGSAWAQVGQAKCLPGNGQSSGLPEDAHLTTLGPVSATRPELVLACNGNTGATIYTSPTGRAWTRKGVASFSGQATSLASDAAGDLVLATTAGIYYSANQGVTWKTARITGGVPYRGFSYIGMTNVSQGVSVPADASLGEVFVTSDGGLTWVPSLIRG